WVGCARYITMLKGVERATPATAAGVDHAPWPVDFGGSLASIDHNADCERKQGESGADHGHGYPPNMAAHRANTQQYRLFRTKRLECCCPYLAPERRAVQHLGRDVEVHW